MTAYSCIDFIAKTNIRKQSNQFFSDKINGSIYLSLVVIVSKEITGYIGLVYFYLNE